MGGAAMRPAMKVPGSARRIRRRWFRRSRRDHPSHMVNAVVTEIPRQLEPVTEDAFEAVAVTERAREAVLARIAELFGADESRRAIID
jgi:hypothetical protein